MANPNGMPTLQMNLSSAFPVVRNSRTVSALSRVSATVNERSELANLRQRFDTLTPREKQVMFSVAQGKQNKTIAYDLCVTESTVKVHKHNVMCKMNLRSVAELTLAIQQLKHIGKKPA